MIVISVMLLITLLIPYVLYNVYKHNISTSRIKKIFAINLTSFALTLLYSVIFMSTNVYAQTEAVTSNERGMAFIAAALVTGMCTIGTGIATGMAAQSGLAAISENESLFGKSLIYVALAEGIAIYGLLISFTILARV